MRTANVKNKKKGSAIIIKKDDFLNIKIKYIDINLWKCYNYYESKIKERRINYENI